MNNMKEAESAGSLGEEEKVSLVVASSGAHVDVSKLREGRRSCFFLAFLVGSVFGFVLSHSLGNNVCVVEKHHQTTKKCHHTPNTPKESASLKHQTEGSQMNTAASFQQDSTTFPREKSTTSVRITHSSMMIMNSLLAVRTKRWIPCGVLLLNAPIPNFVSPVNSAT